MCVCCVQAYEAVQAHVQGSGLGVRDAAGEGWDRQGSWLACVDAGANDARS